MDLNQEKIELHGIVENVVYRNTDNGYAVLEVEVDGDLVTFVGDLATVSEGEMIHAVGSFVQHSNYGPQFRCTAFEQELPKTVTAILRYLSHGTVPGVGPATAKKLVRAFGEDTLEVMAKEPQRLLEIKGISSAKAEEISEFLSRVFGLQETMKEMQALGMTADDALNLFRIYGAQTGELIEDNPYLLCGFPIYKDFVFVDNLAGDKGVSSEDARRLRAGIVNTLRHNMNNGHTCLPTEKLIDITTQFLGCSRDAVEIELYNGVEEGFFGQLNENGEDRTFLSNLYAAERYISDRLHLLLSHQYKEKEDAESEIDTFQEENDILYEDLQRQAIVEALTSGVVVITGGPGTGKTTAVKAIIELCKKQGEKVALCAPTGRAAKRMSELTGHNAKTIHRLLEVDPNSRDMLRFIHNEERPLKCDVVVVDEMSMVDSSLFASLLMGLKPWCRLVLVGDANQLPSVGPGNVLADIIQSGMCPTISLEKIFRQAAQSLIVTNAHAILEGGEPDLQTKDRDFFFLETEPDAAPALICDLVARRLPKRYGVDPQNDIQVLSPSRLGQTGTTTLNDELRKVLNPPSPDRSELRMGPLFFRQGDKVMQTRNAYQIPWKKDNGEEGAGMFNGDIGVVEVIDRKRDELVVRFDDRIATYSFDDARNLEPAYAVTVHKSQGSEFPVVILALGDTPRKLCYRNLLYTALTRPKQLLIIVGRERLFAAMVANDRRMLRYTGLKGMLQEKE